MNLVVITQSLTQEIHLKYFLYLENMLRGELHCMVGVLDYMEVILPHKPSCYGELHVSEA